MSNRAIVHPLGLPSLWPAAARSWACALVAFLPLAGGCTGLTESCGPETRDVTAATAGSTSHLADYAQVMLTQDRGGPGSFYWYIQGPALLPGEADPYPYEEHVLAARLLDGEDDVVLLPDLPVRRFEGLAGIGGDLPAYGGPIAFDALFDLVRAGRAVLEVTTDIPGRELLGRPLGSVAFTDWRRVPCD
ncbi:MAG TPA: hypothetical protein VEB59_01890 [Gemmatimonadales bacterium]|nr:hypothetical protein [Gemmatimonadales bacterium]